MTFNTETRWIVIIMTSKMEKYIHKLGFNHDEPHRFIQERWTKSKVLIYLYFSFICCPQCGNFRIFLPLRFYVKSIFAKFKRSKLPFEQLWRLWILTLWKVQNSELVKIAGFRASKWPKLISRKIWVREKSQYFHTV